MPSQRRITGASPADRLDGGEHARQPAGDADALGRREPRLHVLTELAGPAELAGRPAAGGGPGDQDRGPVVVPVEGVGDPECGRQVLLGEVVPAEQRREPSRVGGDRAQFVAISPV